MRTNVYTKIAFLVIAGCKSFNNYLIDFYYKIGDVVYRKKCQGTCYYEISCVHLASVFFREEVGKH